MIIWIALTLMITVACVGLVIPLVRRHDARRDGGASLEVLKQQLREIDAQAAAEALPTADAEGLRTEVVRRMLAEGPAPQRPARSIDGRSLVFLALGLAVVVALAAALLYARMGRPDLAGASVAAVPASASADHPGGDVAQMISQLEAKMAQAPNDPEGWRMLGWSYMQTSRYADAAAAYGRAAALDPSNAEFHSAQGEALAKAANGQVTPAAQAAFQQAIRSDPRDARARYFLAVYKDQQGDHAGAMADWIALLKSAPPDAPWVPEVRSFVQRIASERGEDISKRLPPAPVAASAAADASPAQPPGPTADQAAAAQQMPADDQQAMIRSMVDGLAARLKASPRDSGGWVRLMRARMVLGEPAAATSAYHDGLKAFADTPSERATLQAAAKDLGVPGA